jgi:hypothetical protein
VAAVEVVGAVGRDDRHRVVERAREQEAEQVPGRLVGPVGVLDHQEHRGVSSGRVEERVHRTEQLGPVGAGLGLGRLDAAAPHPAARAEARDRGVEAHDLLEQLGQLGTEPPEHLAER